MNDYKLLDIIKFKALATVTL